jgi:hypothetical protein
MIVSILVMLVLVLVLLLVGGYRDRDRRVCWCRALQVSKPTPTHNLLGAMAILMLMGRRVVHAGDELGVAT